MYRNSMAANCSHDCGTFCFVLADCERPGGNMHGDNCQLTPTGVDTSLQGNSTQNLTLKQRM